MKNEPDTTYLAQCFHRLPQPFKTMKTRYTTQKEARNGFLDPIMIWWSMFSESRMKAKLTEWTNKRVNQKITSQPSSSNNHNSKTKKPSYKDWKTVDETLLMIIFAVKLKMGELTGRGGCNQKRFWKKHKRGKKDLGVPIIRNTISRDLFFTVLRNITTYDPIKKPSFIQDDRAYKGSWLWEKLSEIAKRYWPIPEQVCIDERMIDCKGRWLSLHKIDRKIHKVGLKLLELCNKQGYIFHVFLWSQKYRHKLQKYSNMPVGSQILMSFVDDCKLHWRNIYADNFFISYNGALAALEKKAFICGTTRRNAANLPHDKLDNIHGVKLTRGQHIHVLNNKNPVVAIGVQDGTTFFKMISTLRLVPFSQSTRCLKKRKLDADGNYQTKKMCITNDKYVEYMGGVDLSNQRCEKLGCNTKTMKWTSHNLFGFLDATVAQAIALYNNTTATLPSYHAITKQQFIDHLIDEGVDTMAKLLIRNYSKWKTVHKKKANWEELKETRYKPTEIKCCKRILSQRIEEKTAR